ncbi:MAG: RNA polymerase subunit sigma-24, partial [Synergistaceae bacterium]|nr:RNA polymerase subunit sigma-24 [Synergistaceae bacterium]
MSENKADSRPEMESDDGLMARIAEGDRNAFEILYGRWSRRV